MKGRIEKILRLEQMSSSRFADEIGVQRSSISHLLTGRNNPSLELVQKILNRFSNINPEWLISGKGEVYKKIPQASLFETLPKIEENSPDQPEQDNIINVEPEKNIETKHLRSELSPPSIDKIVVFYSDKTFREYTPADKQKLE